MAKRHREPGVYRPRFRDKAGAINRELTTLKRAFRLATKLKRVAAVPEIEMLAEATPSGIR
jgi:hypothetical protein